MFSLYRKLSERLKVKVKRQYKFDRSLDPSEVPVIRDKLSFHEKFYHYVDNNNFNKSCSFKNQRNKGQQEKTIECYHWVKYLNFT